MSEILDVGFASPAFQAALSGCLQAVRSSLFHGPISEKPESCELALTVGVATWKTLA
jgi:hypothetical protein